MKRSMIALAVVSSLGLAALAAPAVFAHGPGFAAGNAWGPGMMGGGMMGYGGHPMGYGMGQGMMGASGAPCPGLAAAGVSGDPLTVDSVRKSVEQHLEWMGNDRLKVGTVEAKGEDTILAEIVTLDGSLVNAFEVDRKTGFMRPVH